VAVPVESAAVPEAVPVVVVPVESVASTGGEVYTSLYCPFLVSHSRVPVALVLVVVVAGAVPAVVPVAVELWTWKSKLLIFPYMSRKTFLVLSPDWSMIWLYCLAA